MNYTHLTEDERYQIDDLLREGFSQRALARELNRSPSTLCRELSRNKSKRGYKPKHAQIKAKERLIARGLANVKRADAPAWEYAKEHLQKDQWSPEQICGRLKQESKASISHETIYQRIAQDKKSGGYLYTHLRCKKKRKKRYGSKRSARGVIPNRVDISARPAIVESRERIGDWEGDTIIGSHKGGAVIASMVERKSRFTCLAKAENKTTEAVTGSIADKMLSLSEFIHTITLDNGTEFYRHKNMSDQLGAEIYFAQPYHSWERGLNENTNGLVRQYYPKRIPFDNVSADELQRIADKLNSRPRKCLGYETPLEVLTRSCQEQGVALRI